MTTHTFEETTFAGFKLPRTENGPTIYNPTLTDLSFRFENWKDDNKSRGNIGRVTYPNNIRTADTARAFEGWGTYLEDDRILGLRWAWCDETPSDWRDGALVGVEGGLGWFLDDDIQDDVSRGIVLKLPRGRGYLAGWSLGEGMATEIDCTVFADAVDAARAADSMAENMAEREREYRASRCDECGEHEDDCECEDSFENRKRYLQSACESALRGLDFARTTENVEREIDKIRLAISYFSTNTNENEGA